MYCRHCGASIPDDSVFCPKCGKAIAEGDKAPEEKPVPAKEERNDWYYKGDFEKVGPLSQSELETRIRRRQVDFDGDVKAGHEGEWIPLRQSCFAGLIKSLPKEEISISDKWIWLLAIIPMFVDIILQQTGVIQSMTYLQWIIPVALNLLFIKLDMNELLGAKMNAESWMYMGIILVPVYLVVREVKTNHNFSPAIIWCFLFAVSTFIL